MLLTLPIPAKKGGMEDDYADEDNEDEKDMGKETTINPEPKKNVKPTLLRRS